jgi:hypothetical protein
MIDFNSGSLVINDNGAGDNNLAVGVIDFNTVVSGYQLQGTVDLGSGPNLSQLISVPSGSVRLTNFTAEATAANLGQLDIQFSHSLVGSYNNVFAADALDPYAANSFGNAIPAGNDSITNWQGFVSGALITGVSPGPPPYFNPAVPASSAPLPYTAVTHGPMLIPGSLVNPVFGAFFSFDLASAGDQLILYSSAEVGFSPVPEPSTWVLCAIGLVALPLVRRRARRQ